MSHLMLTKLRTVFQFQHSLCISWFSSFSWSAFSLAAYARCGSLCNFSAWSAKSSPEADRASASVCSALLFTFNSLHHSELSSSHLQQPSTCAFSGLPSKLSICAEHLHSTAAVVCYQHWRGQYRQLSERWVFAEKFRHNMLTNYWNLRTFKVLHCFPGLSGSGKWTIFFKDFQRPVATL